MNGLINTIKNYRLRFITAEPSVLSGVVLTVATGIGAGMFSLPIIMAGAWYLWGTFCLILTGIIMLLTALMIVEVSVHFNSNESFGTFTKVLLGNKWNIAVGISVIFVLYIVTYAYLSGTSSALAKTISDSSIGQTVNDLISLDHLQVICIVIITAIVGFIISCSAKLVGRVTTICLFGKFIAFFLTFYGLIPYIELSKLFNMTDSVIQSSSYFRYIFVIFPFCLVSYVYHSTIPSLSKLFNGNNSKVVHSITYSAIFMILFYIFWITVIMGNIARSDFGPILRAEGDIKVFTAVLGGILQNPYMDLILAFFSNFAFATSLLAVTLGLFDYIADVAKFDDSFKGRLKTSCLTYIPPALFCAFYPEGFMSAIESAGFFITFWSIILPPMLVKAARKKYPKGSYRAPIGEFGLNVVFCIGILVYIFMFLKMFNYLPVYQ